MHLRPDRGVDAVSADEQRAICLGGRAVGVFDQRIHAAFRLLPVAAYAAPSLTASGPIRSTNFSCSSM